MAVLCSSTLPVIPPPKLPVLTDGIRLVAVDQMDIVTVPAAERGDPASPRTTASPRRPAAVTIRPILSSPTAVALVKILLRIRLPVKLADVLRLGTPAVFLAGVSLHELHGPLAVVVAPVRRLRVRSMV
ncbi:MAG: hypothetical protein JWN52_5643 [Actinomycetia bacterium]|nr:hypothetical protein [Actinomycetes bacterium]